MHPLNSKWFSLLFIILIGSLVFYFFDLNSRRKEFRQIVSNIEEKVRDSEVAKNFLEKTSVYFQSSQFLERQAREKLNYKSPDEEVILVFRDPDPDKIETKREDWFTNSLNYQKWWAYILGH